MKNNETNNRIPELTRGEEEIMQILWQLGNGVVNDIIARTDEPHPKYTTVATFLKILENKGYVRHEAEGKSHRYFPVVSRETYARGVMSRCSRPISTARWHSSSRSSRGTNRSRCARWTKSSRSCARQRNNRLNTPKRPS